MDTERKLLDLLGGINFKVIGSRISAAEFKETALYNQAQYARIKAKGDCYQERILNLICFILADKLHPITINRFGNTSDNSLHQILGECFDIPEIKSEWKKCKQLALEVLSDEELDA